MDIIFVRGLQIEAIIGIYDFERIRRQPLIFDIEMAANCRAAAATDHIDQALDYKAVTDRVRDFVGGSEFQLIETLAERVADILLNEFRVPWLRLSLTKPAAIPVARGGVGLIIERGQRD